MLKKLNQQKIIILFAVFFFMLSSIWLFFVSAKHQNPAYNSNDWWTLSFENPKDQSLDFIIKNHSNNVNFKYSLYLGSEMQAENDIIIKKGETKNIQPKNIVGNFENKKITVSVTSDNDRKEIYKNL